MLDMGFEPQIRKIVLQSEMPPAEERQTLVFSATHPPEMKALALDCGRDYVSLTAGPGAVAGEHVAQRMERVAERDKASAAAAGTPFTPQHSHAHTRARTHAHKRARTHTHSRCAPRPEHPLSARTPRACRRTAC